MVSGEVTDHTYHIDLADKENTLDDTHANRHQKKTMPSTWLDSKIPVWARGNIPTNKEIELLQLKEVYIQKNKGPMVGNRRTMQKLVLLRNQTSLLAWIAR